MIFLVAPLGWLHKALEELLPGLTDSSHVYWWHITMFCCTGVAKSFTYLHKAVSTVSTLKRHIMSLLHITETQPVLLSDQQGSAKDKGKFSWIPGKPDGGELTCVCKERELTYSCVCKEFHSCTHVLSFLQPPVTSRVVKRTTWQGQYSNWLCKTIFSLLYAHKAGYWPQKSAKWEVQRSDIQ